MTATTIDLLAAANPKGPYRRVGAIGMEVNHSSVKRFASQYSNPAFGWFIAGEYAAVDRRLPITMLGTNTWVFKAWMMRMNPDKWYNKHIAEAFALAKLAELKMVGETIRGAILASCIDPFNRAMQERNVLENARLPKDTLSAFESLFFNIYDRQADNLYLAHELYPHTRLVELRDDYLKSVDVADLLKRSAYNHKDIRMTLYLAGVGDADYLAQLAERSDREQELGKRIMGNALILSYAGLLNQRSVGLSRGQSLLAASRQSGIVEQESPMAAVGSLLMDQLSSVHADHLNDIKAMVRSDSGNIQEAVVIDI